MSDITVLCQMKPHLRNYLDAKYGNGIESGLPIVISQRNFLGKIVVSLLSKTPKHPIYPDNQDSIAFQLPFMQGFNIKTYNYLSSNSQRIIARRVHELFHMELHAFISKGTRSKKLTQQNLIYFFMEKYELEEHITFDALKRSYYRFIEKEVVSSGNHEFIQLFNQVSFDFIS